MISVKQIAVPLVILLALSVAVARAADLTPDQQEQVKIKSASWGTDHMKAESLSKAKKYQEAEAIYKKVIAERKELGLDLYTECDRLGSLYKSWGKNAEAEETYKQLLEERDKAYGADDQSIISPLNLYAECLEKRGAKEEAKKLRARAVAIQKDAETIPKFGKINMAAGSPERIAEADKMRAAGEKCMERELQSKALAYFERAVQLNPKDAKAICDRGEAYTWFDKNVKAKADYDKAIATQPSLAKAYINRGFLNESLKRYPLAIADFEKAIELNPKDTDTMGSRAKLLDEMGKHQQAIDGYTKIIAVNPSMYWPYIQRAVAYTSVGQLKKAIEDYTTCVNRAPEDPDYYEYRAKVYVKAGQLENALVDYNKLIQLNPKYSLGYHERAKICEKIDGTKSPRVVSDNAMAKKLGYAD